MITDRQQRWAAVTLQMYLFRESWGLLKDVMLSALPGMYKSLRTQGDSSPEARSTIWRTLGPTIKTAFMSGFAGFFFVPTAFLIFLLEEFLLGLTPLNVVILVGMILGNVGYYVFLHDSYQSVTLLLTCAALGGASSIAALLLWFKPWRDIDAE